MMVRLEGKVVIVIGGASGIVASLVQVFHRNWAQVIIADNKGHEGLARQQNHHHHHVSYIHCNVTIEEGVRNLVDTTVGTFGRLDVMINNAGESVLDTPMPDVQRLVLSSEPNMPPELWYTT